MKWINVFLLNLFIRLGSHFFNVIDVEKDGEYVKSIKFSGDE
jgi:hypothetical protein